jgi:cathepsin D
VNSQSGGKYNTTFTSEADGRMGLGLGGASAFNAKPVFQTLVSQGVVDSMFSFNLAPSGSELFLGGANHNLYKGKHSWVPLSAEVCQMFNEFKLCA